MLSGRSTAQIQQNLCITPQQKTKLKWAVSGFILGAALVYGGVILGKECDSPLSQEELYEFMKQSMEWLLPAAGGGGLVGSMLGYLRGRALASEIPLINHDDYLRLKGQPTPEQPNIQSLDDRVFTPSGELGVESKEKEQEEDVEIDSSVAFALN